MQPGHTGGQSKGLPSAKPATGLGKKVSGSQQLLVTNCKQLPRRNKKGLSTKELCITCYHQFLKEPSRATIYTAAPAVSQAGNKHPHAAVYTTIHSKVSENTELTVIKHTAHLKCQRNKSQHQTKNTYPGNDKLSSILVVGIDSLTQQWNEAHQIKVVALGHNVLDSQSQ